MLRTISKTPVLWGLFLVSFGLFVGFGVWMKTYGIIGLDSISKPDEVRTAVATMTEAQRNSHWWMTLVLDYVFPLAYGSFFAGMALRFFGRLGLLLALPALICIPVDMVENTIQLLVLTGNEGGLAIKSVLTPLKVYLFLGAAAIALAALLLGLFRLVTKRSV